MVLAACGTDICDRAHTVAQDVITKTSPCSTTKQPVNPVNNFNLSSCKSGENSCSDPDKTTLTTYLNCVEGVAAPSCGASDSDSTKQTALATFTSGMFTCASSISATNITPQCATALGVIANQ